ncbi:hypothetical protein GCM10020258_41390 [Sphingomonas yabuuchiae]
MGDEAGEDAEIRARFLKVMFDEARRMQRLVEDLISLSRIEADKYRQPAQPVDMAELVDHVWEEFLDPARHAPTTLAANWRKTCRRLQVTARNCRRCCTI